MDTIWRVRGLMLALPLPVVLVFLAAATIHRYFPPLTDDRARDAILAYSREHPDAFDGRFTGEMGRVALLLDEIHGRNPPRGFHVDLRRCTYSYVSRERGPRSGPDWTSHAECGHFERRWGTRVVVPGRE